MHSSNQGSQFTSHDWQGFLRDYNLVSSMSRRGNCHDNAVAESFLQLLKRERIRRQIYSTRDEARVDVFNYIEMFYNSRRRHNTAGDLSARRVRAMPFPTAQKCLGKPGRFTAQVVDGERRSGRPLTLAPSTMSCVIRFKVALDMHRSGS